MLIFLNAFILEPRKYLVAQGRNDEAIGTLRDFGCGVSTEPIAAIQRTVHPHAVHMTNELAARTWALSIAAVIAIPTVFVAAFGILVPVGLALLLVWRYGVETRGRDLRDLDAALGVDGVT